MCVRVCVVVVKREEIRKHSPNTKQYRVSLRKTEPQWPYDLKLVNLVHTHTHIHPLKLHLNLLLGSRTFPVPNPVRRRRSPPSLSPNQTVVWTSLFSATVARLDWCHKCCDWRPGHRTPGLTELYNCCDAYYLFFKHRAWSRGPRSELPPRISLPFFPRCTVEWTVCTSHGWFIHFSPEEVDDKRPLPSPQHTTCDGGIIPQV